MKKNATPKFQHLPLGSLASIRAGYNFRGRIEPVPSGDVWVVQTKDITNDGRLDLSDLSPALLPDLKAEHFLQEGDILLRSRGGAGFPAAVAPALRFKAIAAFPILLLRVDHPVILPDYLVWQLNQSRTQAHFQGLAQSTFVPTLSKASLLEISLPVPPLAIQKQIVELNQMIQAESRLCEAISAKRQVLASRLLMRYAEEAQPERSFFSPLISTPV